MAGWGKLIAGAALGVAGTLYATNEELRRKLPEQLRDLPDDVRERFKRAMEVGKEAAARKQEEISRELSRHGGPESRARKTGSQDVNVPPPPPEDPDTTQRLERVEG
jgi:hypothetical protein